MLAYDLDLGVLFNLFNFSLSGTVVIEVDLGSSQYRVTMAGQGPGGLVSRTEARGSLRDGRFKPLESRSTHIVRGRQNTTVVTYDYERGRLEFHALSHTLLLGRRRQVDDVLPLLPGQHVDDLISTELNFAANTLEREPDGTYHTLVVRRAHAENEGPDEVSPSGYRAELVPLRFRPSPEAATGRLTALVDLTRLSSWARADQPARVTFSPERQLESVHSSLILGTTLTVRVTGRA